MPCLSMGLTKEILQNNIYQDLPFREELIQNILERYPGCPDYLREIFSYFTKSGLIEFMETGRVEIFPYDIYDSLSSPQRCEVLDNIISLSETKEKVHFCF